MRYRSANHSLAGICIRAQGIPTIFFNSLAPGRPRCHFKTAIFNLVLLIGIFTSSKDNALRWMPRDLTDDKSTLVQVMAWCRQATSHYLSQCWPSYMSPYGVTRPQWVNRSSSFKVFIFQKQLDMWFRRKHSLTLLAWPWVSLAPGYQAMIQVSLLE